MKEENKSSSTGKDEQGESVSRKILKQLRMISRIEHFQQMRVKIFDLIALTENHYIPLEDETPSPAREDAVEKKDVKLESQEEYDEAVAEQQRELTPTPKNDKSIQFAEWIRKNGWLPDEETKGWSKSRRGKPMSFDDKTTSELYTLFINSKA